MPEYTHTFDFQFDSFSMDGSCEFNVDGTASFETTSALSNLSVDQMNKIQKLFRILRELYKDFGDITKIEVEKE